MDDPEDFSPHPRHRAIPVPAWKDEVVQTIQDRLVGHYPDVSRKDVDEFVNILIEMLHNRARHPEDIYNGPLAE